jgi:hypothetical protein
VGDTIILTRIREGRVESSVHTVLSIAPGGDGLIETYDETSQQCLGLTPNDAAIHADTIQVKKGQGAKIVLG